jgi:hypothetical protein
MASRAIRPMVLALALLASLPAHAVQPDEVLKDPALEHRAREISAELRCLVCQNQSIDDSDAPLAKDLRLIVRERLEKGDSNTAAHPAAVADSGAGGAARRVRYLAPRAPSAGGAGPKPVGLRGGGGRGPAATGVESGEIVIRPIHSARVLDRASQTA